MESLLIKGNQSLLVLRYLLRSSVLTMLRTESMWKRKSFSYSSSKKIACNFLVRIQDCNVKRSLSGNEYNFSSVTQSLAGIILAPSFSQAALEISSVNQATGILTTTNIKRLVQDFFNNIGKRALLGVGALFKFVIGFNRDSDSDVSAHGEYSCIAKLNDQNYHDE